MFRKIIVVSTAYILFIAAPAALAEKVVVIVNSANSQSINEHDIKNIYLDNIIVWDNGKKIHSYDLPLNSSIREKYSKSVLGITAKESARMWANKKITNNAKNPPRTKPERLIVSLIAKDTLAIGYVRESSVKDKEGIRVIFTVD